jgi:DNA-directed RNA polymerase subunit L
MKKPRWTEDEINLLKQVYQNRIDEELLIQFPGKTFWGVRNQANRFGLCHERKPWTNREVEILRANYLKSYMKDLPSLLPGRTKRDIRAKIKVLDLDHRRCNVSFNEREILDFSIIDTEEKAYILGFLAADGNIRKDMTAVVINLASRDHAFLEMLRDIISPTSKITTTTYTMETGYVRHTSTLRVGSRTLCEQLISHGITPAKTETLQPPTSLKDEMVSAFVRGFFDGDGSIGLRKEYLPYVSALSIVIVSFGKHILEFIKDWYEEQSEIFNLTITKKRKKYHHFRLSGWRAQKFLSLIYEHSTIYLPRKYETAKPYIGLVRKNNLRKVPQPVS